MLQTEALDAYAEPMAQQDVIPSTRTYESYRWNRDRYTKLGRIQDIGRVAIMLAGMLWQDTQPWSYGQRTAPTPAQKAARHHQRAAWLRESLLDLGPTFIKIGQFFSTRADLLPPEYIDELSKLQDQVPAFDYEQVVAIVQREFGKPIHELYARFNPIPIASASLGQVHHAELMSGEAVAVKVQRPGLPRLFAIDLGILHSVVAFVQHRTQWGKGGRDWLGVYEECRRTLWEEVNYLNEGQHAAQFRRNFQQVTEVMVPRIHWRYTTPAVLTMEYLPGIKVTDFDGLAAAQIDRQTVSQVAARAYLMQVLQHGFFHADPHPGNLAVNLDGRLIFYDFGMMGQLPPQTQERLRMTFNGILRKDGHLVVQSMVELGALAPGSDLAPVRRSVQYMLDTYFSQALEEHADISMAQINDDLYELTYHQPFRFPASFTFVLRALSSLEALGKRLDPEFNFMEVIQPFAEDIMAQETNGTPNSLLAQLSRQAAEFTNTSFQLPQNLETTLTELRQGDLKMRVSAVETNRELRQLNTLAQGGIYALVFSALLLSGTSFLTAGWHWPGAIAIGLAALTGLNLVQMLLFKLDRPEL